MLILVTVLSLYCQKCLKVTNLSAEQFFSTWWSFPGSDFICVHCLLFVITPGLVYRCTWWSTTVQFLDVAAEQRMRGSKRKSSGSGNSGCTGLVKFWVAVTRSFNSFLLTGPVQITAHRVYSGRLSKIELCVPIKLLVYKLTALSIHFTACG